jgi:hypothetical protein
MIDDKEITMKDILWVSLRFILLCLLNSVGWFYISFGDFIEQLLRIKRPSSSETETIIFNVQFIALSYLIYYLSGMRKGQYLPDILIILFMYVLFGQVFIDQKNRFILLCET